MMSANPKFPFFRKLSFRQAFAAVLVAMLVGFLVTWIQIIHDLRLEREKIRQTAQSTAQMMSYTAARAAYRIDGAGADEIVLALINSPGVVFAEITEELSGVLATHERPANEVSLNWFADLVGTQIQQTEIPLVVPEYEEPVGFLTIRVDPVELTGDFSARVSWLILTGASSSLVLAMLLLAVFHQMTTRRIQKEIYRLTDAGHSQIAIDWAGDELDVLIETSQASMAQLELAAIDAKNESQRLSLAAKSAGFGVWEWDIPSDKLVADEKMDQLFGFSTGGLATFQAPLASMIDPDEAEGAKLALTNALKGKKDLDVELPIVRPDGSAAHVRFSGICVRDDTGQATKMIGVAVDLTESRATQEKLVRAQRMEAIGQLTGGVAHDFNNLLAVIVGNLELLEDETDEKEKNDQIASAILAARKGADLTKNMLSFARRASLKPETIDLNSLIVESQQWISRTLPGSVEVRTKLVEDVWPVELDKSSAESAFLNLLVNARDAVNNQGTITVETENVVFDEAHFDGDPEAIDPGNYVMLAVSDTGHGIPESLLSSIFEPFFTTKPVGAGSGLGLAMIVGFVKQSSGAIRVYSEEGVGTTFKLFFPAKLDSEALRAPRNNTGDIRLGNGETILLVEDQAEVRKVVSRILTKQNYTVLTASSGDEAIEILQNNGKVDLLLTDIVMPGKTQGADLAKYFGEKYPNRPIVFMSGYAREALNEIGAKALAGPKLSKPVRRNELLSTIADALE